MMPLLIGCATGLAVVALPWTRDRKGSRWPTVLDAIAAASAVIMFIVAWAVS